ncbi:response regulator [Dyadobacter fermentans]|uniref:Two component transcriptional regulator, LuxR family n=1 Tax=Dyadobacter fermentans (strain ATCC 700827 / DSM 18053 / CIP 107007 / KCTC 52180 / NS114) TaxID=471854 RepID=C6VVK2_DYAFD|nr:response regulator transcription factor [Dyadobacter fermentans]ACT96732.1 two component transcriptional regulator, LuxR family [Dyadobacter fermentans DSM 18053]
MTLQPGKILLVDDHRIFNDGLKRLIDEEPSLTVCGQVYDPKDIFTAIEKCKPDLLLLDINLLGQNGIDLGRKVLAQNQGIRVIVLTMYDQLKLLDEARRAGMHGYLLKDSTTAVLLKGINTVLSGGTYFESLTKKVNGGAGDFGDTFTQKLNLTFREIEIIGFIKKGYTNEQISAALNLSFFTVKTHRKNIHFKLGINNVAELIEFAIQNGI